jgi:hypothetical protein
VTYKTYSSDKYRYISPLTRIVLVTIVYAALEAPAFCMEPSWRSPNKYRLILSVDSRRSPRSNSPASIDIDFVKALSDRNITGTFDEDTIEVAAYEPSCSPKIFDTSRDGYEKYLLPQRIEKYYGINKVTISFVIPDETCKIIAVYFDTIESGLGRRNRYKGLVGDGDFFMQGYGRRETGACHFIPSVTSTATVIWIYSREALSHLSTAMRMWEIIASPKQAGLLRTDNFLYFLKITITIEAGSYHTFMTGMVTVTRIFSQVSWTAHTPEKLFSSRI